MGICGNIYTWEKLKPDYQEHFNNWSAPGYTNNPEASKPQDFDSKLMEKIVEVYKKE